MRHAREDYNRIQDPDGKIPDLEPVFLLRAQDEHAAATLRFYAGLVAAAARGFNDLAIKALDQADLMDAWPVSKQPGL